MLSRLLIILSFAFASGAVAQPSPPDPLPDSVRQRLQVELREMKRTDQRVRFMVGYGTFRPPSSCSEARTVTSGSALAALSPPGVVFLLHAAGSPEAARPGG